MFKTIVLFLVYGFFYVNSSTADLTCTSVVQKSRIVVLKSDPLYSRFKAEMIQNDPVIFQSFESLPEWAQIDLIEQAYRSANENPGSDFIVGLRGLCP